MKSQTPVQLQAIIVVNGKTNIVEYGPYKLPIKKGEVHEYPVNIFDAITTPKDRFSLLVEELKMISQTHTFNLKLLWSFIANSPTMRTRHLETFLHIPRYVALQIVDRLIQRNAGMLYNGCFKKFEEFAMFIRTNIATNSTVRSIETMAANQFRYILPLKSELGEMSEEMLLEEMRVCEQSRGKHKKEDLAILREMLTAKRKEESENNPRMSDIELLKSIAREDAEEGQQKTTERRKKKNKKQRR